MDARSRYTKNIIKESFLSLLNTHPLNKITVKEICELSEINRATFYKYYENAYDLLDKLEQEILNKLLSNIETSPKNNLGTIFRIVLNDIKNNYDEYKVLFAAHGETFKDRIFAICYGDNMNTINALFPDASNQHKEWLYYFIAEGCNGVLNKWIENKMSDDIEEIVTFCEQLILNINQTFRKCYS